MTFASYNYSSDSFTNPKINVLYFAEILEKDLLDGFSNAEFNLKKAENITQLKQLTQKLSIHDLSTIILIEVDPIKFAEIQDYIQMVKNNWVTKNLITIFFLTETNPAVIKKALKLGVSDCYTYPVPFEDAKERIKFLSFYKVLRSQVNQLSQVSSVEYRIPVGKRVLDIALSSIALIFLAPVLLIISLIIALNSPGPVFYISKRVGTGYKIFNFYKFRSMRIGADTEMASLSDQNQYESSTFFKVVNDPRITKFGTFLRNTSIDELPQLLNVIKGDMSLVGNRPLPLYEAEKLTTNEWSVRFLAPAGLTGLWQISKRGKKDMSEVERKELDNFYTKNYSLWLDIKIIFKTIPALLQKQKV